MSFGTILIIIFMVMFWMFRAIVALCTQFSIDFKGIVSYNLTFEIIISFITLICIILVIRRNLIGALAYFLMYGLYYGQHLFNSLISIVGGETISIALSANLVCDLMATLLAIFCLFDVILDKNRKAHPKDEKTDWYFNNKDYDEELKKRDSRDDTNEYKYY